MSTVMSILSDLYTFSAQDQADDRRRKLLNVLLVVMAIGTLGVLATLLVVSSFRSVGEPRAVKALYAAIVLMLLGMGAIFAVNRYVSGELASILFLLLLIVVAVFSDEPQQVANGRGLFVFALPILAASVLLRPWACFAVAGLSSLVVVAISLTIGQMVPNVPAILGFFVFAFISWLSARSLEGALRALRAYSEQLEERVEERTRELEKAQEQLVRQEKLAVLGQLAGGVGHELRDPLGAIANATYLLRLLLSEGSSAESLPEVQETLEILDHEIGMCEKIINSLLDFGRTRAPVRQRVDVNGIVQRALSRTPVPQNVEVVSQMDKMLPTILADSDQLAQVFGNIALNAVEAMPGGGQLTVSTTAERTGWVAVSFADTGVGVPGERREAIFEPLYTSTTTRL